MMHKQFLMLHTHSHLDRDVRDKAAKNILLKLIANKLNGKIITNIKFWKVTHGVSPGARRLYVLSVAHQTMSHAYLLTVLAVEHGMCTLQG
jgi:predicted N-acetyltransferase YhbS